MKCNVGKADRSLRIVAGLIVIALGLVFRSWWGAIGLLPLITGALGYCGLYRALRIDTFKPKSQ